jgi:hypothetical protein
MAALREKFSVWSIKKEVDQACVRVDDCRRSDKFYHALRRLLLAIPGQSTLPEQRAALE